MPLSLLLPSLKCRDNWNELPCYVRKVKFLKRGKKFLRLKTNKPCPKWSY